MIERYSTKEMSKLWSDESKFKTWLEVEMAVCEVWAEKGVIPHDAMKVIREKANFDIERIKEIEQEVHHDVIAFVTCVAENIGPEGRYVHLGLTSSDVIDTASSLLLTRALDIVIEALVSLINVVREKAQEFKYVPCIGRTHGVHAEPMTFGLKILNWLDELLRGEVRLNSAREMIKVGKISGAVGTYAHCPPDVEEKVCARLGLRPAPISTQILQRDKHATIMSSLAILGGTLERIALEIRHLQRTEVLEAAEPFSSKQKGSSAMPHKRNPILCERICGMSRLLRGYALAAMENMALWHERDISHSSVERVIWPDSFNLIHYMILMMQKVISNMDVFGENISKNLDMTRGLIFSQRVLLALVDAGLDRNGAYEIIQSNAKKAWRTGQDFRALCKSDERITKYLSLELLDSLFDVNYYIRHVDSIFDRFTGNPYIGQ
ncbi:adenylosuccinate lyase [Thermovirga lienii DSM 17291]|uniref:Adenylosuccinate lyase n=1 Tax=Thermovirga lienii (strain ATCC BAA-1197 / DSM 17291 / Cas60314) TaxID=580340 RepID=G7VAB1_THELD|nr:adenylosuccinate lyase [Thermovirga lienii]AER66811.1 adenylosuccinate lyase [Thermovirga lienii DSM 17291]MDN5367381.1 adenylosuccinate lyase [Thermovirga sp.]HCD71884.1 adenylosuccinate lyase [Thermovirga lienii]